MCLQFAHPRQQGGRGFSMTQCIELKIGNVLDKLKRIESDSVDCIVTSPPYYGLRKYKAPEVWWDTDTQYGHSPTEPNNYCECGAWLGQLGLEPDYRMYLNHMLKVTAELKRVLKPTGTLWWNMGTSYNDKADMQLPTRLSIRMTDEQGWILRNTLIWHKRNHMPSSVKDRLANSYEYVFFFTKQKRYFFNLDAVRVPVKFPEDVARRMHQDKQANVRPFNKGTDEARHTKQYKTKYLPEKAGQSLQGFTRNQIILKDRIRSYADAKALFPNDTKAQKEYIKNVHDHNTPNPLGKNPADVLELSTMPFKGAHFAVFPPKLPEFCIKAGSPEEVCSACGKPKVNIIKEGNLISSSPTIPMAIKPRANKINRLKIQDLPKDPWGSLPKREREITGTKPTCTCNAPFEPAVVLDPFAGSGTTMQVARQLGRSAIGIELSEEYAKMIKKRMGWGCGLDIEWKED